MSTIYSQILKLRRDMTDWMIHFTHDSPLKSARETLLTILTEGVLRPGFSPRGRPKRPTIYGPDAAVCFSEQPLSSFLDYLAIRRASSVMAGYGLLIHKHDVYAFGGLPVIHGLSSVQEVGPGEQSYNPARRLLTEECLALHEQYRYVTFDPLRSQYPIDWTHEREWRWSESASRAEPDRILPFGWPINGAKCRVHAFVEQDRDIDWLQSRLSQAYDSENVGLITVFDSENDYESLWRRQLARITVVSLEAVRLQLRNGRLEFSRFEDLPAEFKHPILLG